MARWGKTPDQLKFGLGTIMLTIMGFVAIFTAGPVAALAIWAVALFNYGLYRWADPQRKQARRANQ